MDLTTLARAKQYLVGSTAASPVDPTMQQLIAAASGAAMQFTSRRFQRVSFSGARLNGSGSARLALPSNPIISVSSVAVDGYAYQPSADAVAVGYQYDGKFLYLFGGPVFSRGLRNVLASFVSGYATSGSDYIPQASPYALTPVLGSGLDAQGLPANTAGPATVDNGVVFTATGAALAPTGNAPTTGQYAFSDGVYTFAAADKGLEVTMSYDFVPADVEQAVINTIGTWLKQRDNLGIASRTLANESVSYRDLQLSKAAQGLLQPYRWIFMP